MQLATAHVKVERLDVVGAGGENAEDRVGVAGRSHLARPESGLSRIAQGSLAGVKIV